LSPIENSIAIDYGGRYGAVVAPEKMIEVLRRILATDDIDMGPGDRTTLEEWLKRLELEGRS
jgi:hypothetical protein